MAVDGNRDSDLPAKVGLGKLCREVTTSVTWSCFCCSFSNCQGMSGIPRNTVKLRSLLATILKGLILQYYVKQNSSYPEVQLSLSVFSSIYKQLTALLPDLKPEISLQRDKMVMPNIRWRTFAFFLFLLSLVLFTYFHLFNVSPLDY